MTLLHIYITYIYNSFSKYVSSMYTNRQLTFIPSSKHSIHPDRTHQSGYATCGWTSLPAVYLTINLSHRPSGLGGNVYLFFFFLFLQICADIVISAFRQSQYLIFFSLLSIHNTNCSTLFLLIFLFKIICALKTLCKLHVFNYESTDFVRCDTFLRRLTQ